MTVTSVRVHPVYGAIYRSGEFVQRGAVIGMSVDMSTAVTAPASGWVHVVEEVRSGASGSVRGLMVEILDSPPIREAAEHIRRHP